MGLEKLWEDIQKEALSFLDFRKGDFGHAATVKSYADFLSDYVPGAKKEITIASAILHDIGWVKLGKNSATYSRPDLTTKTHRIIHQVEGVLKARKILKDVKYPKNCLNPILDIILEHDVPVTLEEIMDAGYNKDLAEEMIQLQSSKDERGFKSPSEGVLRDADRLWRFNQIGFWADCNRRGQISDNLLVNEVKILKWQIGFFYSPISVELAKKELDMHYQMIEFLYYSSR